MFKGNEMNPLRETPKRFKKLFRQYAARAFEAELKYELEVLDIYFEKWRNGEISSQQLSKIISDFTHETLRRLQTQYDEAPLEATVAASIARGLLPKEEIPDEVIEHLSGLIEFYKDDWVLE